MLLVKFGMIQQKSSERAGKELVFLMELFTHQAMFHIVFGQEVNLEVKIFPVMSTLNKFFPSKTLQSTLSKISKYPFLERIDNGPTFCPYHKCQQSKTLLSSVTIWKDLEVKEIPSVL